MWSLLSMALVGSLWGGQEGAGEERVADPAASSMAQATRAMEAGDASAAVTALREALALRRSGLAESDDRIGEAWMALAHALSAAGEADEALKAGEETLAWARAQGEPSPHTMHARKVLVRLSTLAGDAGRARLAAEEWVSDVELLYGSTPMAAEAREVAARLAWESGALDDAEHHLTLALGIHERFNERMDPTQLASPLHGLATVLEARGQIDDAMLLRRHAVALLEGHGKSGTESWGRHQEQLVHWLERQGELSEARERYAAWTEAAEAQTGEDVPVEFRHARAARWLALGDGRRALAVLDGLEEEAATSPMVQGWTLCWRARALGACGRWEDALALLDDAVDGVVFHEGPMLELRSARAEALQALGRHEEARVELMSVFGPQREALGEEAGVLAPLYLSLIRSEVATRGLGPELRDLVDLTEASMRHLAPGALASLAATHGDGALLDAVGLLAQGKDGDRERAFLALDAQFERAIARSVAWSTESEGAAESAAVRSVLAAFAADRSTRRTERPAFVDALAAARATVQDDTTEALLFPRGASLDALRAALVEGDAYVCLVTGEISAWAWVVHSRASDDLIVSLGNANDLRFCVHDVLRALHDPSKALDVDEASARLLAPLWSALASTRRVWVATHGVCSLLPFEVLRTPNGGRWAATCDVRYTPSARRLLDAPRPEGRSEHLVVASSGGKRTVMPPRLRRAMAATRATPGATPRVERARLNAPPRVMGESGVRAAWTRHAFGLVELQAPTYLDGDVASRAVVDLGAPRADGAKPMWQRLDGLFDVTSLRHAPWRADTLWLSHAATDVGAVLPRGQVVADLVAACWDGGCSQVVLSGWNALPGTSTRFEEQLRLELEAGTDGALARVQRRWLTDDPDADPRVWARSRVFGRSNDGPPEQGATASH